MAGTSEPRPPAELSEISTREEFAAVLTALRTRAGLSVRAIAQALETPTATVGDYFSGRHLPGPGQQQLFSAMLRICGVEEGHLGAWHEVVARLRVGSDGRMRRVSAPYQGLAPFELEDHERFFGREAVIEEVLERLRAQASGSGERGLVLVVGPSGAGKSSLLRAGIRAQIELGALGNDHRDWSTCLFSPGEKPLEAFYASVADLPDEHRVVIVDQLEELFASPGAVQDRFLEELQRLALTGTLVLAGLRADFYEQAVRTPALLASLRANPVLLGPMTEAELRSAIVGPARHAGVQVEEGLIELLIADLAPREATGFAHDAGALPLLSHALLQSWERARGNRLTTADYMATGGLQGAVSQTAEELFSRLSAEQQELARRVFMRLVRVPEDGPAVRRRAGRRELEAVGSLGADHAAEGRPGVDEVVDRFVDARLMTVDVETVELSHDALLTAWPRLASWVEQDRDGLRLHRLLTDATNEWIAAGRDQELLLREARLQLVGEWAQQPHHRAEMNANERAYLAESQELMRQRRRAVRRRARQMRLLVTISLLSAVAAIVLAVVALHASHNAARERDDALSRQVALQAAAVNPTYPSLAMQLAVLAYRVSPTTSATSALLNASDGELPTRLLGPTGPAFLSSAPAVNRLAVAYSAVDRIKLFDIAGTVPQLISTVRAGPSSAQVFAVALSPDGNLLAAGGTTHEVTVWSLKSPGRPMKIATLALPSGTVYGLAFSPDGHRLAAVDAGRDVYLWSVPEAGVPHPQPALTTAVNTQLHAVQFAPDRRELVAAGSEGVVGIWRTTGLHARPLTITVAGAPTLNVLTFSPAGTILAVGGTDDLIHRWRLGGTAGPVPLRALHGFTSWVESVAFSPDGHEIAAGSSDSSLRVWPDLRAGPSTVLKHPAPVTGAVFASNGSRLLTIDSAGTLRVWTMPPPTARLAPGKIFGLNYTANGNELAVISSGSHGNAQIWNTTNPTNPRLITNVAAGSFGAAAGAGAMTSNGKLLAIANARAQVRLFDISRPRSPHPVGPVLTGATPYIEQMAIDAKRPLLAAGDDAGHINLWNVTDPHHPVREPTLNEHAAPQIMLGVAFSPNGHLLASASTSGEVTLWSVTDLKHPTMLARVGHLDGYAYTVAFTPDGRVLAAAGADQTVRLWNIVDPAHPRAIGKPLTGPTSIIYDIAINQNGTRIAAATTDGNVWLWDISDPTAPQQLAELPASASDMYAASFQPHSDTLIAGGTDQELHLWDDNPSKLAKQICRVAGTPLTRTEWAQYVQTGGYAPPCGR